MQLVRTIKRGAHFDLVFKDGAEQNHTFPNILEFTIVNNGVIRFKDEEKQYICDGSTVHKDVLNIVSLNGHDYFLINRDNVQLVYCNEVLVYEYLGDATCNLVCIDDHTLLLETHEEMIIFKDGQKDTMFAKNGGKMWEKSVHARSSGSNPLYNKSKEFILRTPEKLHIGKVPKTA